MSSPTRSLARGRVTAEALMVDVCTVERVTGQTFSEQTGTHENVLTTIYEGKCRVQARDLMARSTEVAGRSATFLRLMVNLPMSTEPVLIDDLVTVTEARNDAQLVGRKFRVASVLGKTFATARRIDVEEVL